MRRPDCPPARTGGIDCTKNDVSGASAADGSDRASNAPSPNLASYAATSAWLAWSDFARRPSAA
jgi:hypothetical protein